MTVKLHGGCAEYNGVGNTWWKYVGGGSSFEERDANLEDVVTWNLNMQAYKLGYCKMVRGRMTMTGIQTFHRASIDFQEINALAIPGPTMVTMFFPEQNVSMTGWPDSVSVEDHLTGDLVTIRISLYVFTGWTPRITSADPLPPPVPQPSSM